MRDNVKKYFIIGIIIILLILLGAFALMGNNEDNNTKNDKVNSSSNNASLSANKDSGSEDPMFVSADKCPEGTVLNEEKGECEPKNKVPSEIGPVGEITGYENVEGYWEYINSYHHCYLEGRNPNASGTNGYISQSSIDKHSLYVKIDSLKKGEYLNFSVVYKDSDGKEKIWTNFKSDSVEKITSNVSFEKVYRNVSYYSYLGCLTNPNDKSYKYCTQRKYDTQKNVGVTIIEHYWDPRTGDRNPKFSIERASFTSEKEIEGFKPYLHLRQGYGFVIRHKGESEIN